MTNAIEIQSVHRSYGRVVALDDVNLTVPEESICGLLGRNGAGKTTIMSILSGQDRPSRGSVKVVGQQPFENQSVLSQVSFVRDNQRYPHNYHLHQILRIAPSFYPYWSKELADELVAGFGIPHETPVRKFSRGELSAVAIVLGLASRSPVTLLDEPYLGLDVTARGYFHDMLLRDYIASPRTIILSTHLIEESERLFDRVVVVDRGKIQVEASIDDVRQLAYTVSGAADAVDAFASGRTVLKTHGVTNLKSATIEGTVTEQIEAHATSLGARVSPVSLQELVEVFGTSTDQPGKSMKGQHV